MIECEDDKKRIAQLEEQNSILLQEVKAAREAARIKNDMVVTQFEKIDVILRKLEEKIEAEKNLSQRLENQLAETKNREHALANERKRLQETQAQLVQAEKMGALAGLVAGVAHEINTPVGVGVTAASHLAEQIDDLGKLYSSGKLKKSQFSEFITVAQESIAIIMSNLSRASRLVQSFKNVAVDQSSEERRIFRLKAYLEEILVSLSYVLKKTQIKVVIDCPEELQLNSYPGALSQIVTNLVLNAVRHAFRDNQEGQVIIAATEIENDLTIRFTDNGKGIPKRHLERIFDPFFTTARSRGGAGLGLHIVFNIATRQLGGTIECQSELGKGTSFILKVPSIRKPEE